MQRRICKYFFLSLLLALVPVFASAQVYINEIMYDPSGADSSREWVEMYNTGSAAVDVSNWKFLESASASNHSLTLIQGSANLPAGGLAVIVIDSAKFLTDWPGFAGTILRAAFGSLNNTGSTLILKDGNNIIQDQSTYTSLTGAAGDGNTLQRQNDASWLASGATPGLVNSSALPAASSTGTSTGQTATSTSSTSTPPVSTDSVTKTSAHYSSSSLSLKKFEPTLELSAGRDRIGTVGSPLEFKVESNFTYTRNAEFKWNFGDGLESGGERLSHTYEYPGEYVVVLNATFPEGTAVARTSVKIVAPELNIVAADPERIEIKNNAVQEVSLFGRALFANGRAFVFPQDTIIKPGQSIFFSAKVTSLFPARVSDVNLLVIGNMEQPDIPKKIEEEKAKQVAYLEQQIALLKDQMALLPRPAPVSVVASVAESATATSSAPIEAPHVEVQAAAAVKSGWADKVRKFFLPSRQ